MSQKLFKKLSVDLKLLSVVIFFFLFLSLIANAILLTSINNSSGKAMHTVVEAISQPVVAAEIYPEFVCGCCGKPLDPENICCGDMRQKIEYIDDQVEAGLSEEEIIMRAVKKFGLNSLAKDETKQAVRLELALGAAADAPKIVFEADKQDLGVISQSDNLASTSFNFKNDGKSGLVIDKLSTSCGCTSAAVVYRGEEGPTFTMPGHGKANPEDWSVTIAPGESAELKVYYDPKAHGPQKKDRELITRTISVFSNDAVEFEKQLRIELEQIP